MPIKNLNNSRYLNQTIFLASMHEKEKVIAPPFEDFLGCSLIPTAINTDIFGTFTGEIKRKLSPSDCVKEKCYQGLESKNAKLGVANEGSFGPHPLFPLLSADHEILFFTDRHLGFELMLSKISLETNFRGKSIADLEELNLFAQTALFPSHGLILRPNLRKDESLLYKGIRNSRDLQEAFVTCSKLSRDSRVWVETDMRACMNPTRMKVIGELAHAMAKRLATPCPLCETPGWGIVQTIQGLQCESCGLPTNLVHSEVHGCCLCPHKEVVPLNIALANPGQCFRCNP